MKKYISFIESLPSPRFQYAWVWLLWLLSQTWITLHIWTPKCERLASTEKLFVSPMYNSLLIDQSLALNRRRDDEGEVKTEELNLNPDDHDNEVRSNAGLRCSAM